MSGALDRGLKLMPQLWKEVSVLDSGLKLMPHPWKGKDFRPWSQGNATATTELGKGFGPWTVVSS